MFLPGLLMIHDALGGGEQEIAKLSRGKEVFDPGLDSGNLDIESGGNDTTLVKTAIQLDDNLAGPMVIYFLKFIYVSMLLHHLQHSYDHTAAWSYYHLSLPPLFGVVYCLQAISQY